MPALSSFQVVEVVRGKLAAQVDRAASEEAAHDDSVTGDSAARAAFLLLGDADRRTLFRELLTQPLAVPRIRHLIGSPPFSFLAVGECDMLDAGRLSKRRVNVSYSERLLAPPRTQFGSGQLVDERKRKYRRVDARESQLQVCRNAERWPMPGETLELTPSKEWLELSQTDESQPLRLRVTGLAAAGASQTALISVSEV
jgi:hypothetical protein